MQVSLETTEGLERRLSIAVDAQTIDEEIKQAVRDIAKRERMPGFRPGKVPASVIQKRYGAAIEADVKDKAMQRHFYEAVIQEKITPAGAPTLEVGEVKDGQFHFSATFEVFPEVELNDFAALEIEKVSAEVADGDVDNMVETLRKQRVNWVEAADGALEEGDRATFDFVGKIDGEEFEGGKAEGFSLEIGSGRMIPGFEDGLKSHKAGEQFTIKVTFPEDYHAENLKGKEAEFDITLTKVEKAELPEVTADFIKQFGIESGELADLKAELQKNMERELKQKLRSDIKEQVLDKLLEANDITVPSALVKNEVEQLRKQAMERFGGQVDPKNLPNLPDELFEEQAQRRVKVGLLLGEVIKVNELKADDEKVQEHLKEIASAYEQPEQVIEYYNNNKEMKENLSNVVLEEQAVDLILDKAKVTEVTKAFDEIMNN
ncbi:trigger factor [Celerinatantimonas sp. MCCC 1A17872]|uniref:trigger factor n=1 Tax=Celerinatantimonas sp. MCCC 1A17872 TaxID=3177514 RepID=UPI0038C5683B